MRDALLASQFTVNVGAGVGSMLKYSENRGNA